MGYFDCPSASIALAVTIMLFVPFGYNEMEVKIIFLGAWCHNQAIRFLLGNYGFLSPSFNWFSEGRGMERLNCVHSSGFYSFRREYGGVEE